MANPGAIKHLAPKRSRVALACQFRGLRSIHNLRRRVDGFGYVFTSNAQDLTREELRETTRYQCAHDCVAHSRGNRDAGLTQDVFAFPPTGDELSLEATQAIEVIECAQLARSRAKRAFDHGMLAAGNILGSFGGEWRSAQGRHRNSFRFQSHQSFKDQKRRRSLRRVGQAQDVFQIPGFARGYRTGSEKADQFTVNAGSEILFVVSMQERIERYQPAKCGARATSTKPAQAKPGSLCLQLLVNRRNNFDLHAGPARLVHAGTEFLCTVAARIPGL